jgi:hypothetical protein
MNGSIFVAEHQPNQCGKIKRGLVRAQDEDEARFIVTEYLCRFSEDGFVKEDLSIKPIDFLSSISPDNLFICTDLLGNGYSMQMNPKAVER